jgi:hypothetical protein
MKPAKLEKNLTAVHPKKAFKDGFLCKGNLIKKKTGTLSKL